MEDLTSPSSHTSSTVSPVSHLPALYRADANEICPFACTRRVAVGETSVVSGAAPSNSRTDTSGFASLNRRSGGTIPRL